MFQRIMRWGLPCFGAIEEIIRNSYPWSTSSSPPSQHEHGLMRAGVLDEEAQIMFMANSACCTMKCRLPRRTASYCSLMQWLKGRKDAGIWPLATVDVPRMHTGTYVRDEIKLLIKSLIRFIQHLHRHGQCTTGGTFGPNNIGVVGEDLKFTELKLSGFTEQLQEENYKSLSLVIEETIFMSMTAQLPYDMKDLLDLLKNPRPPVDLISNHVALMNPNTCRDFIMKLSDKKKTLDSRRSKIWKISIEDLNVGVRWEDNILHDSPLWTIYSEGKYKSTHKASLIRFLRNAAAHLSDHSRRGKKFKFEDISLIITDSFPNVLADLQRGLHRRGILDEFL